MNTAAVVFAGLIISSILVLYSGYLAITKDRISDSKKDLNSEEIKSTIITSPFLDEKVSSLEITKDQVELDTDIKSTKISEVLFIDYTNNNGWKKTEVEIQNMLNNYFSVLIDEVKEAKNKIYVLDYFEHEVDINTNEVFYLKLRQMHMKYFKEIENVVKENPNLEYVRILQLPLGKLLPFGMGTTSIFHYASYALGLIDIYSPIWQHILNIYRLDNFKLYVLPIPLRTPSEMIIDDKVWFFESDKYNKGARANPDLLFVHRAEQSESIMRAIHYEQATIREVISNYEPLTQKQLRSIIKIMAKPGTTKFNPNRSNL